MPLLTRIALHRNLFNFVESNFSSSFDFRGQGQGFGLTVFLVKGFKWEVKRQIGIGIACCEHSLKACRNIFQELALDFLLLLYLGGHLPPHSTTAVQRFLPPSRASRPSHLISGSGFSHSVWLSRMSKQKLWDSDEGFF